MGLFVTDGPRVKGLKVLIVGILIAFAGGGFAFVADAISLGRILILLGWIVAVIGLVWHFVILLSGNQKKDKANDK